jgi:hypothetical protein
MFMLSLCLFCPYVCVVLMFVLSLCLCCPYVCVVLMFQTNTSSRICSSITKTKVVLTFNILAHRFFEFFHFTFPACFLLPRYIVRYLNTWDGKSPKSLYIQMSYTIVRTSQRDNLTLNSERFMTAFSQKNNQIVTDAGVFCIISLLLPTQCFLPDLAWNRMSENPP